MIVQFRGDFDTGDTSQWELETEEDYSLTVEDGGPGHPTAGRFEVRDGDTPVDDGERSEAKTEDRYDVFDGFLNPMWRLVKHFGSRRCLNALQHSLPLATLCRKKPAEMKCV